jgi:NAD(P)H-dependent flavin oxidoreductase YrpB (nitropropane dioxygenase family)
MSRVTALLGSQYPIIQGAMGVICNPELVAAVSEAGGFGLLATAFTEDPEFLRNQVTATKQLTNNPFGSNIFVMNPLAQKFVEVLAEEGVKVVTVSGGSPKGLIPILHDLGIKVIVVSPTVEGAKGAEALGADAVVAEGAESGGIQGFKGVSTMVLVPAVVDAVKIPVIAAGGIGDSRGYKAALALGAEGVQIGTRFIATKECVAHSIYKTTIFDSNETGTGLVNMGRFQIRALRTSLVERLIKGEESTRLGFTRQVMEDAWIKGNLETGVLPAGQVAGLVSDAPSVRQVINEIIR